MYSYSIGFLSSFLHDMEANINCKFDCIDNISHCFFFLFSNLCIYCLRKNNARLNVWARTCVRLVSHDKFMNVCYIWCYKFQWHAYIYYRVTSLVCWMMTIVRLLSQSQSRRRNKEEKRKRKKKMKRKTVSRDTAHGFF